jgi:dienelactone hydrolase
MIGAYGAWAASLAGEEPGKFSFRRPEWNDVESWRTAARQRLLAGLAQPDTGGTPQVTVRRQLTYDGLHVEELSWQLPYGPPTEAIFVKPAGAEGKLPGILALHDHSGKKYFGASKIAGAADAWHPLMVDHHQDYYGGAAWANELAKRGYAVLAHDAFAFASRRVRISEVPEVIRGGLTDDNLDTVEKIEAYHRWASGHESIMAKSLFCAGTTWPGVTLAEDQRALDVLCAREDVDAERVGCGGLSGGGLRTVYLAGLDPRIRCAVCVGMMTTWRDYLLNKSHTHTWMIYVPLLPPDLDYPEMLGLRVPLPTLVLNDIHDSLFTLPEMERAETILRQVYEKAGASDRYRCSYYPGPHKFDLAMQAEAFDWFDQWLK